MSEETLQGEQFMKKAMEMKNSFSVEEMLEGNDLEIAMAHNKRRKGKMISAMLALSKHLNEGSGLPNVLPSDAFNPNDGCDKTNIHYVFKSMTAVPPWELPREMLLKATAVTLMMIDVAEKLFPCPQIYKYQDFFERFTNRWMLPKFRPEWSKDELAEQKERYKRDMEDFEKDFNDALCDISIYFKGIENPATNPVRTAILETHTLTKAISEVIESKLEGASESKRKDKRSRDGATTSSTRGDKNTKMMDEQREALMLYITVEKHKTIDELTLGDANYVWNLPENREAWSKATMRKDSGRGYKNYRSLYSAMRPRNNSRKPK